MSGERGGGSGKGWQGEGVCIDTQDSPRLSQWVCAVPVPAGPAHLATLQLLPPPKLACPPGPPTRPQHGGALDDCIGQQTTHAVVPRDVSTKQLTEKLSRCPPGRCAARLAWVPLWGGGKGGEWEGEGGEGGQTAGGEAAAVPARQVCCAAEGEGSPCDVACIGVCGRAVGQALSQQHVVPRLAAARHCMPLS